MHNPAAIEIDPVAEFARILPAGLLVDRVWIEGNTTQAGVSAGALQLNSSSGVVVRNSVVANNNSGTAPPANIFVRAGQSNLVLNNTFASNTSAQPSGFVRLVVGQTNGATVLVANNLFHGNIATAAPRLDIRLNTSGISLQNNRFTGLSGFPSAETGSSTGPAGFNGSGYDLAGNSTARDAGALFAPLFQGVLDAAAVWPKTPATWRWVRASLM